MAFICTKPMSARMSVCPPPLLHRHTVSNTKKIEQIVAASASDFAKLKQQRSNRMKFNSIIM